QAVGTVAVRREYDRLVAAAGSELAILLELNQEELTSFVPARVLEAIMRVREGRLTITPGYDGVYGTVKIFGDEMVQVTSPQQTTQMHLF
ncbi:MAG: DNA helicase UvrD, partial [Candidatus Methylomirabilales bacterium]